MINSTPMELELKSVAEVQAENAASGAAPNNRKSQRLRARRPLDGYVYNPMMNFPRNDKCWCGSQLKAKKCCLRKVKPVIPYEDGIVLAAFLWERQGKKISTEGRKIIDECLAAIRLRENIPVDKPVEKPALELKSHGDKMDYHTVDTVREEG